DLAEDTVEERRLPRSIRSDYADDLARPYRHRDAVDRLDGAVRFAHIGHFEKTRGHFAAAFPNRSGIERSPPGSQIISATTAKPKAARYQFCMKRSHSGSRTTTTVPSTGPKKRPEPPTMTASSIVSDAEKWNGPGSTNWTSAAR